MEEFDCLKDSKIKVIYPHFANTFLLPYYIDNCQFLGANANCILCKWDNNDIIRKVEEEEEKETDILIFYATDSINSEIKDKFDHKQCDFCFYQPRLMFVNFSIDLYNKYYRNLGAKLFNQQTIAAIENEEDIDCIPTFDELKEYFKEFSLHNTIYSDTQEQANYLKEKLVISKYFNNDNTKPPIKLLYYSAPYSIYLLNQFPEFLPIRLEYNWLNTDANFQNFFKTYNYIICKKSTNCPLKENCPLPRYLTKFYSEKFYEARNEPKLFFDIFNKYIEKDNEQIPFHIFKDVDCFAKAISLFHKYDTNENNDNVIETRINNYRKLTQKSNRIASTDFTSSLTELENTITSFYVLLIYSYILEQGHSRRENIFQNIARSLIDKNFLYGKYYLIFIAILNSIYLNFRSSLVEKHDTTIDRIIERANITEKDVYSIYRSYLIGFVTRKILEITQDGAFNLLISAIEFQFLENLSSKDIPFSIREYNDTIKEINRVINFIKEKAPREEIFTKDNINELLEAQNLID